MTTCFKLGHSRCPYLILVLVLVDFYGNIILNNRFINLTRGTENHDDDREIFLVMCLSTKNEVVGVHRCHVGSLNASIANCREIFKSAILNNSSSIIIAHQHPSGYLDPSSQDIQVTKKVAEAGRYLDIELLDSVIVNYKGEGISLKEKGYL